MTTKAPKTIQTIVVSFCKIDADRDQVLRDLCIAIGDSPTYEEWEAARAAAIEGYKSIPANTKVTDAAAQKFWERLVAEVRAYAARMYFDFVIPEKPKAENAEAARKRAERANPYKGKTVAELVPMIEALKTEAATAEPARAKDIVRDLQKAYTAQIAAEKTESKSAAKAEADALKPRRDAIAKSLKDADAPTLALLENVLIARGADEKAARSAWALIIATAPKAVLLAESAVSMKAAPEQSKGKRKTPATV